MRSTAYRKACQIAIRPDDQGARLTLSVVRANLSQSKADQQMPWLYLFRVAFSSVCRMDGDHTVRRVPSFGYTYRVSFLIAKLGIAKLLAACRRCCWCVSYDTISMVYSAHRLNASARAWRYEFAVS
jgi:hypothetical protein